MLWACGLKIEGGGWRRGKFCREIKAWRPGKLDLLSGVLFTGYQLQYLNGWFLIHGSFWLVDSPRAHGYSLWAQRIKLLQPIGSAISKSFTSCHVAGRERLWLKKHPSHLVGRSKRVNFTSLHILLAKLSHIDLLRHKEGWEISFFMSRRKVKHIYYCLIHTTDFETLYSLSPKLPDMLQLNIVYIPSTSYFLAFQYH